MASFADLVCDEQSPAIDCKHGITWFTHEDEDYLELRRKHKDNPHKYRENNEDAIGWGWFEGDQVVFGCPQCMERFEKCEQWIQENEEVLRKYLRKLGKQRLEEAQRLAAIE